MEVIALGVALACVALVWLARDRFLALAYAALRPWIRRKLGGYRHRYHVANPQQPAAAPPGTSVAVVGAGLGGIAAAAHLAERGFEVTLIDAAPHLGGKIGAWRERGPDGATIEIEHGFHAFFRHYYNLNAFLARIGVRPLQAIDDYVILGRSGERRSFGRGETAPLLNLLELARSGLFRMSEIARIPQMHAFLSYDSERTFAELDGVSVARFLSDAELPRELALVFTTFGRAFFADASRMSTAELIKSFHFYYLSHAEGLLYDYPTADYREAILEPITQHLATHGVRLRLGTPIDTIDHDGEQLIIDGEPFAHVVLATDVVGARRIAERSPALARVPGLVALRPSQRYAVLRVWIDREIRRDIPVFVTVDGDVLDAVAVFHRITPDARRWAADHHGAVLELHCYAVPDALPDDAVRDALLTELESFFGELAGSSIVHERLQLRANFSAFHTGMAASRPQTTSAIPGLTLAGDWVKLPFPAMLMEAAFSAGLLAANAICAAHGVRTFDVWSVPPRGILFRDTGATVKTNAG